MHLQQLKPFYSQPSSYLDVENMIKSKTKEQKGYLILWLNGRTFIAGDDVHAAMGKHWYKKPR